LKEKRREHKIKINVFDSKFKRAIGNTHDRIAFDGGELQYGRLQRVNAFGNVLLLSIK